MNKNKLSFEYLTLNLHEDIKQGKLDNEEPNIMTEYEEKFMKFGPIYKLIAKFTEELWVYTQKQEQKLHYLQ